MEVVPVTDAKRSKVQCIRCRKAIELPEYVGHDYSGDLHCVTCESLLRIKLDKWEVKQYKVVTDNYKKWRAEQPMKDLREESRQMSSDSTKSEQVGDGSPPPHRN